MKKFFSRYNSAAIQKQELQRAEGLRRQLDRLSVAANAPAVQIYSLIQASDGNFYGTVSESGFSGLGFTSGLGVIFRMDTSGDVTVMSSFASAYPGATGGAWPCAGLIQSSDGKFYGTTYAGGSESCSPNGFGVTGYGPYGYDGWIAESGCGTVYTMDLTGNVEVLYEFTGQDDGGFPAAPLIQGSDGYFYGTTSAGGAYGVGTVFKMDSSGNLTVPHTFSGGADNGPVASLVQAAAGSLYGTAAGAPSTGGEVFKIDTPGNFSVLHTFSGPDGWSPVAPLIQGTDGSFYGTMWAGVTLPAERPTLMWVANTRTSRMRNCF